MYVSTFSQEEILDSHNLVIKSLFLLIFLTPTEKTNEAITGTNREDLERLRYNPIISKYAFLSLVNPAGYNFISKHIPDPYNRRGLDEDFYLVNSDTLYDYLQIVNVLSTSFGLN